MMLTKPPPTAPVLPRPSGHFCNFFQIYYNFFNFMILSCHHISDIKSYVKDCNLGGYLFHNIKDKYYFSALFEKRNSMNFILAVSLL